MDDSNAIATRYGQTMATWVTPDVGRRTTKTAMQLGWSTSKLIKWALERSLLVRFSDTEVQLIVSYVNSL